jgi:hypothetical protein
MGQAIFNTFPALRATHPCRIGERCGVKVTSGEGKTPQQENVWNQTVIHHSQSHPSVSGINPSS